jgi:tRNA modification GTPase
VDPVTQGPLDEAMAVFMKAPRTYTREDCLELQVHGGAAAVRAVLRAVIQAGARPAAPGEFTLRAFLNGRIDLPQAEAVVDLIQARSRGGLELARRQLSGELSGVLRSCRGQLLDILAEVESAIDFPEDEIPSFDPRAWIEALGPPRETLARVLRSFWQGRLAQEGAAIMILGTPNVGKSSLLNAMVGFERAIVTEIPGTTRDIVEEPLEWRGLSIRALDTAGLRPPVDPVEAHGHRLLLRRMTGMDLVIFVLDGSRAPEPLPAGWEDLIRERPCVVAVNKADLPAVLGPGDIPPFLGSSPVVRVSAKEGLGIDALLDAVHGLLMGPGLGEEGLLTNERHRRLVAQGVEFLGEAVRCLEERSHYVELCADALQRAVRCLGEILGEEIDEGLLGRIFERFCIGK